MSKKSLNFFMLSMMNISAICSIANLPFAAQQGFSGIFYYIVAAIIFFIPVGLVSAELATGWPQRGGVYIWVREGLGEKCGFVAIWLQWIENIIWFPTVLSFCAAAFAFAFKPSLANNNIYVMFFIIIVFCLVTFISNYGIEITGWITSFCSIIGMIIPGFLIITLGIIWLCLDYPSNISFSFSSFFPNVMEYDKLSVFAAVLLSFGGLELNAVHANEVENPQKNYPKSIFFSMIIILLIFSLGSLAISIVLPKNAIELQSGTILALVSFLDAFGFKSMVPLIAFMVACGSIGQISTWTVGPSKGLMTTARHGELPPFLQKMNRKSMPVSILWLQALIVALISSVFLFMPSVSASYQLLFYLTAQLYLIMYILMFLAGIVLRYKYPKVKRSFKIPFGNMGMNIIGIIGVLGCVFAIICGFLPPEGLGELHIVFFEIFLILGIAIFSIIPIIIHNNRKDSWHLHKKE